MEKRDLIGYFSHAWRNSVHLGGVVCLSYYTDLHRENGILEFNEVVYPKQLPLPERDIDFEVTTFGQKLKCYHAAVVEFSGDRLEERKRIESLLLQAYGEDARIELIELTANSRDLP